MLVRRISGWRKFSAMPAAVKRLACFEFQWGGCMPETKIHPKVEAMAEAFRVAKAAGLAAATDEDGGTCNMDSPAFRVKGVRAALVHQAAEMAGVTVCDFKWWSGSRWWWLGGFLQGQGNCRQRMSTAATQALKAAKPDFMEVCQYCQMD